MLSIRLAFHVLLPYPIACSAISQPNALFVNLDILSMLPYFAKGMFVVLLIVMCVRIRLPVINVRTYFRTMLML